MMKFALSQNVSVLRETMKKTKSLSSIELPDNLVDLMYETMSAQGETVPLVSVRDILYSAIPLPFMPDRIDYKIGKGCCDEIVKCDGLFVPCSKHCDGDKCAKHLKTPTGLGTYWERHEAWSKNEPYCVIIAEKEVKGVIVKEKELKEKSYGTYLHSKKLDSVAVTEELSKWGVSLQLDPSLFRAPAKPLKKSRGRKATKKVASTESDDEQDSEKDSETEKPKKKVSKPKKKAPEPEPESESEPEHESEDETLAQIVTKVGAITLEQEPEAEPEGDTLNQLVTKVGDLVTKVGTMVLDAEPEEELEEPSDDEDVSLSMISKAKPKEKPKSEKSKEKPKSPKSEKSKEKPKSPKSEKSKEKRSESPELKKERMEEKKPKKGAIYKGKKESMSEVVYEDETYLFKDGKYYSPETLEAIAWDNKGEFELL